MQVGYIYQIVPFVRVYPVRRHIHSRGCFYPAAGYRDVTSGGLGYVGSNGYYWSSSPNGASGCFLYFSSTSVSPSASNGYRGYGFPARCIAVFIAVFFYMINYCIGYERKQFTGRLVPRIL
jgi:hypothetical protein